MHDTYIGRRSENNIKCVMHVDLRRKNRTAQYNLPCYWLYEWFSQFHSCGTYSVLSQSHRLLSYTLWMVLKGIEWCLCWRAIRKLLTLAEALQCQTDFHLPVTSQQNLCSARSCFFKSRFVVAISAHSATRLYCGRPDACELSWTAYNIRLLL